MSVHFVPHSEILLLIANSKRYFLDKNIRDKNILDKNY